MPGAISRLPNLLDDYRKASSGDFRTRKSDVPKNWGKETGGNEKTCGYGTCFFD